MCVSADGGVRWTTTLNDGWRWGWRWSQQKAMWMRLVLRILCRMPSVCVFRRGFFFFIIGQLFCELSVMGLMLRRENGWLPRKIPQKKKRKKRREENNNLLFDYGSSNDKNGQDDGKSGQTFYFVFIFFFHNERSSCSCTSSHREWWMQMLQLIRMSTEESLCQSFHKKKILFVCRDVISMVNVQHKTSNIIHNIYT